MRAWLRCSEPTNAQPMRAVRFRSITTGVNDTEIELWLGPSFYVSCRAATEIDGALRSETVAATQCGRIQYHWRESTKTRALCTSIPHESEVGATEGIYEEGCATTWRQRIDTLQPC